VTAKTNPESPAEVLELTHDSETSPEHVMPDLFETTETGKDGILALRSPTVAGLDLDYSPWSGKQILAAAREIAPHFTSEDFDRMIDDLLRHED
jgi:hypothetical protein